MTFVDQPYRFDPGFDLANIGWHTPWPQPLMVEANTGTYDLGDGNDFRTQSYVELADGRILAGLNRVSSTTGLFGIGYIDSLRSLLTENDSVTFDRLLVESRWDGSGTGVPQIWAGFSRHPNGNIVLSITTRHNPQDLYFTGGLPAPSGGLGATEASGTFLYESADEGDTWFQTHVLGFRSASEGGSSSAMSSGGFGLIQRTASGVLLITADRGTEAFGIRRHLYYSTDEGDGWTRADIPADAGGSVGVGSSVSDLTGLVVAPRQFGSPGSSSIWMSATGANPWSAGGESFRHEAQFTFDEGAGPKRGALKYTSSAGEGVELFEAYGNNVEPDDWVLRQNLNHPDNSNSGPMPYIAVLPTHLLFIRKGHVAGIPFGGPEFVCGPISW